LLDGDQEFEEAAEEEDGGEEGLEDPQEAVHGRTGLLRCVLGYFAY
jgi:hypothetical protein